MILDSLEEDILHGVMVVILRVLEVHLVFPVSVNGSDSLLIVVSEFLGMRSLLDILIFQGIVSH